MALVALISTIAAPGAGARPDGGDEKGKQEQERASGDRADRGRPEADDADGGAEDRGSTSTSHSSGEEREGSAGSGDRSDAGSSSADDGGARGLDKFESSSDDTGSSVSDMTITVGCYSVDVTSSKDISHVEVTFADGTTVKFEGLSGNSYSNHFDQPVLSAHAKSGTTIVTDTVSGDCSTVAPPTTCPDGSPMPSDGICDQVGGRIIELCPDGSEMPAGGDIEDCDPTVLCPDGSEMPAGGNCGEGVPCPEDTTMDVDGNCVGDEVRDRDQTILCPDGSEMPAGGNCGEGVPCPEGTTMDADGNCLEDEVTGAAEERPCPLNPIMGVVAPVLCGDESADPIDPENGDGAAQDENPVADDEGSEGPGLGAGGTDPGPGAARDEDPADADQDSVLGTRLEAPGSSRAGAPAVAGAVVASAPEVESAALPATGAADLVAFVVLALMLIAFGALSWRGRRSDT